MSDDQERQRLASLYEGLRLKLLDLTKRNRMLNYGLGARGKRNLQIVDEVLEEIYRKLASEDVALRIAPLPDPEGIPREEKTEEFISAFDHAKVSDVEYLTKVEALESAGRDDEMAITVLDREL